MKKEDAMLIAQMLDGIKDAINRLEKAYNKKDRENLETIKREIMDFQQKIANILQ